jgi:hypothetical protein
VSSVKGIKAWLTRRAKADAAGKVFGALGILALAALAFFITFGVVYVAIIMGFAWIVPMDDSTRLWISGLILVVLVVGNATTDRRYLESYSVTTGTRQQKPVTLLIPGVGLGSTVNPFAPDSAHSFIKILTGILLIGPRLLTAGVRMLSDAVRLVLIDADSCAPVLSLLLANDERVPIEEVQQSLRDPECLAAVLGQLRLIDGVLFLSSEPAGLALMSELRGELRKVKKRV